MDENPQILEKTLRWVITGAVLPVDAAAPPRTLFSGANRNSVSGGVLSHGAASPSRTIFLPFSSCAEQGQDDNSGWQQRVNFLTKSDILLKC